MSQKSVRFLPGSHRAVRKNEASNLTLGMCGYPCGYDVGDPVENRGGDLLDFHGVPFRGSQADEAHSATAPAEWVVLAWRRGRAVALAKVPSRAVAGVGVPGAADAVGSVRSRLLSAAV